MKLKQLTIFLAILFIIEIQVNGYRHKHQIFKKHHQKSHQEKEGEKETSSDDKNSSEKPSDTLEQLPSSSSDGSSTKDDFQKAFKNFHLSKGEVDSLFRIADKNHNGLISNYEWQGFYKLFVSPFMKYVKENKNRLSEEEAMDCLKSEDFKSLNLTQENKDVLFDSLGKIQKKRYLNLADYLFLRRANLAWQQCAVDGQLSQVQIRCALEINVPGKRLEFSEEKKIFETALVLKQGKSLGDRSYLKFLEYLNIARIYYFFHEFQIPFVNGKINKKDLLRAINQQVLPHHLTPNVISQMYGDQDAYDFSGFACSFWVHRLFVKYSASHSNKLDQEEFLKLLQDKIVPRLLLKYIDGFFSPTQAEIEAISQKTEHSLTEQDFLMNSMFLQISQEEEKDKSDGGENRKLVFTIFDENNTGNITFSQLLSFFKYTWAFINYDTNQNMDLDTNGIRDGMKTFIYSIPFSQDETRSLNKILDLVAISKQATINIKLFYTFFTHEKLFSNLVTLGSNNHCIFSKLKVGMDHLGLKISKSNRGLSQEGQDQTLKETTYNWRECFKNCVSEEMTVLRFKSNGKNILKEQSENPKATEKEESK